VLRISELERYLRLRYGTVLPDDYAGREDLVILLNHVAHNRTDPRGKMLGYVRRWAPWSPADESESLLAMILAASRKYIPKRLGELLRLTEAERRQLCITTIRTFDATNERKDREYKKVRRDEKRSGRSSAAQMISFTVERAPGPDPTMESGISNGLVASYNFAISDSSTQYAFDPSGAGSYTLTARSGSPNEYSVSYSLNGTTWSSPQLAQPLQILTLPAGVHSLQVSLLDDNGNPATNSFTFYVTFATLGTFSGGVTSPPEQPPTLTVSEAAAIIAQSISVSDPDGAGYQTLELWDSDGTTAGGQFIINGVAQSGGHEAGQCRQHCF
jgi:hypothetical protein